MKPLFALMTGQQKFPIAEDIALLITRIGIGLAMLTHAIPKLMNFAALSQTFFDPFGLGSQLSLIMALFAELVCSIALILGVFTRLASAMLLFTMLIAVYMVGMLKGWAGNELATIYCFVYGLLIVFGGGKYSLEKTLPFFTKLSVTQQKFA
ncbi:DoxX family protein [Photobacterium sp. BZF1]|uniref:DoxX family protein n=1 Tax=Photobacterium sp. BZF1 TaxID=1904457 RepID=UPI001CA46C8E|nr:DoxX family protein [Photobacterium sp. BZF1]